MSRIDEIIKCGRAPGFAGAARDPQSADEAVPRALKQLEQTHGADRIVRDMGWKPTKKNVDAIRKTWGFAT